MTSGQKKVLESLEKGLCTWDQLRALTKQNDERLGYTLGELLDLRKIWTAERDGVRVYGIERRVGLVPRLHAQRRIDDRRT